MKLWSKKKSVTDRWTDNKLTYVVWKLSMKYTGVSISEKLVGFMFKSLIIKAWFISPVVVVVVIMEMLMMFFFLVYHSASVTLVFIKL